MADDGRATRRGTRFREATPSRHRLIKFYDTLKRHLAGVLAWAKLHLTNAALEGNNSRVCADSASALADTATPRT